MILVAVRDLLFASKIDAAAKRVGAQVTWAPRNLPLSGAAADRRPDLVLADLGERGMIDELRVVRATLPRVRIVGYLGHLEADLMDEARSIGVDEVLTRGQLAASLDAVLVSAGAPAPATR